MPTDDNDVPVVQVTLESVEIFESHQMATATFQPDPDWAGTANVTVTLTDDDGKVATETITVSAAMLENPGVLHVPVVPVGQWFAYDPAVGVPDGAPVEVSVSDNIDTFTMDIDPKSYDIYVDPYTHEIIFKMHFPGAFELTYGMSASWDAGLAADHVITVVAEYPRIPIESVIESSGTVYSSFLDGDRLYVACSGSGLEIHDVSDLDAPVLLGRYNTNSQALDVKVVGGTAFVADGNGGLVALDVSNPADIKLLDSVATAGKAVDLLIEGNYAYVAETAAGVGIFDISDPTNIREVGRITALKRNVTDSESVALAKMNQFLFISDQKNGLIAVFNVANLNRIFRVTTVDVLPWSTMPVDIALVDQKLFIVDLRSGLIIYDVSRPTRPVILSWTPLDPRPRTIEVDNETAFLGRNQGGFVMVDISNPESPYVESEFVTSRFGGVASFAGSMVVLSAAADGVFLMDGSEFMTRTTVWKKGAFVDDGVPVTVRVNKGFVRVFASAVGVNDIDRLIIRAFSDSASAYITTARGAMVDVSEVTIYGNLRGLTAKTTVLTGDLFATGAVSRLALGGIAGPSLLEFNLYEEAGDREQMLLELGTVTDGTINTHGVPIKKLKATSVTDTDGVDDDIIAPWIQRIDVAGSRGNARRGIAPIAGDFEANLVLSGAGAPRGVALSQAKIAGQLGSGLWDIGAGVGTIRAGRIGADWILEAEGMVKKVDTIGDLGGNMSALYFDRISTRGAFSASINATGFDPRRGMSIKTLMAGSIGEDITLSVSGAINMIKVKGSLGGSLSARYFNQIRAGGALTADITATGFDTRRGMSINRLMAGTIGDITVDVSGGINSVKATQWLSGSLTADWVGNLMITGNRRAGLDGDFGANLHLTGSDAPRGITLKNARISGDLADSLWDIGGTLKRLKVSGTAENTTVRTSGDMLGVQLGASKGSDFLAGISGSVDAANIEVADFVPDGYIHKFKISGLRLPSGAAIPSFFDDSHVCAATMGVVDILNADFTDSAVHVLDSAGGGEIRRLSYRDTATGESWSYTDRSETYEGTLGFLEWVV